MFFLFVSASACGLRPCRRLNSSFIRAHLELNAPPGASLVRKEPHTPRQSSTGCACYAVAIVNTQGKVEGNHILSKSLHEEGKRGLNVFGYEPERALRASDGYQCALEHSKSCPQPLPPVGRPRTSRIKNTRKNTEVLSSCNLKSTRV